MSRTATLPSASPPIAPRQPTPFAPLPIVRRPASEVHDETTDLSEISTQAPARGDEPRKTALGVGVGLVEIVMSEEDPAPSKPKAPTVAANTIEPASAARSGGMRAAEIMAAIQGEDWTMTPDAVMPTMLPARTVETMDSVRPTEQMDAAEPPDDDSDSNASANATVKAEGETSGPGGDWTMSADPSADDGWTAPAKVEKPPPKQPRSGNRVVAVASAEPLNAIEWEEKPTGIGVPLVEIDPSLMQAATEAAAPPGLPGMPVPLAPPHTAQGPMPTPMVPPAYPAPPGAAGAPMLAPGMAPMAAVVAPGMSATMMASSMSMPPGATAPGMAPTTMPLSPVVAAPDMPALSMQPSPSTTAPGMAPIAPPTAPGMAPMQTMSPIAMADAISPATTAPGMPPAAPIASTQPYPMPGASGFVPPSPSTFPTPPPGSLRAPTATGTPLAPRAPTANPLDTYIVPVQPDPMESTSLVAIGKRKRTAVIVASAGAVLVGAAVAVFVFGTGKSPARPAQKPIGSAAPIATGSNGSANAPAVQPTPSPVPATPTTAGSASQAAEAMVANNTSPPTPTPAPPSPTPTPAPAPPQPCSVAVDSAPQGAEVWLDQSQLGVTPATVQLPCGVEAKLIFKKAHLGNLTRAVTPDASTPSVTVRFPTPIAMMSLTVTSSPPGATITVGGKVVGITPTTIRVPASGAMLNLSKDGFTPDADRVSVKTGSSIHVSLKRIVRQRAH